MESLWTTCCLVSPVLAIAFPKVTGTEERKDKFTTRVFGVGKNGAILESKIVEMIRVPLTGGRGSGEKAASEFSVALAVLERPIWELGWVGLRYLERSSQAEETGLKSVSHPDRKTINKNVNAVSY